MSQIRESPPESRKFMVRLPRYEPVIQDHSATIVAKNCLRRYFYRIVLGREPRQNPYQVILDFGNAYHKFRELLETHGYGEAMRHILGVKLTTPPPGNKFEYLTHARLVKSCQFAYEEWQKEKKANRIEVIAVEQPFNIVMPNGSIIGGRADQIIRMQGKLYGRDFKTTSKDQTTFTKGTEPNDQATRYIYGESKLHGEYIQGIIFEALYNTKTQGPKIYTVLSTRTKTQLDIWEKEQVFQDKLLSFCRDEDIWPMQEHNCTYCPYHSVCRLPTEMAQMAKLESDFMLKPWDSTKVEQKEVE